MNSSDVLYLSENFELSMTTFQTGFMISTNLFGIGISAIGLIFAWLKLKLSPILKFILVLMIAANLIGRIIQLIGLILAMKQEYIPSMGICRLLSYPLISTTLGTFLNTSLISMLRLYMSKLAANCRFPKLKIIFPFVILAILLHYSMWPLFHTFMEWHEVISPTSKCAMKNFPMGLWPYRIAFHMYALIIVSLGIWCDCEMYLFIKQRNTRNSNSTQLVPWTSNHESLTEDLDVPIKATMISTFGLAFQFFIVVMGHFNLIYNIMSVYTLACMLTIVSSILPILLMYFTVKKQNRIQNAQPPAELQLHEMGNDATARPSGFSKKEEIQDRPSSIDNK